MAFSLMKIGAKYDSDASITFALRRLEHVPCAVIVALILWRMSFF